MMKKFCINIEEKTILGLDNYLKESTFKNKSHFIELAIDKSFENGKNGL